MLLDKILRHVSNWVLKTVKTIPLVSQSLGFMHILDGESSLLFLFEVNQLQFNVFFYDLIVTISVLMMTLSIKVEIYLQICSGEMMA